MSLITHLDFVWLEAVPELGQLLFFILIDWIIVHCTKVHLSIINFFIDQLTRWITVHCRYLSHSISVIILIISRVIIISNGFKASTNRNDEIHKQGIKFISINQTWKMALYFRSFIGLADAFCRVYPFHYASESKFTCFYCSSVFLWFFSFLPELFLSHPPIFTA